MIVYQKRIYNADLRANPDVLYVFGDNLVRDGYGGQAREMRGEPNAVGVATKHAPGNRPEDYFSDDNLDFNRAAITEDLAVVREALAANRTVVIPLDGIGTGFSAMSEMAPETFKWICSLGLGLGGQAERRAEGRRIVERRRPA